MVSRAPLRRLFCAGYIGAIESNELHFAGGEPRWSTFHHDASAVQPSFAGEAGRDGFPDAAGLSLAIHFEALVPGDGESGKNPFQCGYALPAHCRLAESQKNW